MIYRWHLDWRRIHVCSQGCCLRIFEYIVSNNLLGLKWLCFCSIPIFLFISYTHTHTYTGAAIMLRMPSAQSGSTGSRRTNMCRVLAWPFLSPVIGSWLVLRINKNKYALLSPLYIIGTCPAFDFCFQRKDFCFGISFRSALATCHTCITHSPFSRSFYLIIFYFILQCFILTRAKFFWGCIHHLYYCFIFKLFKSIELFFSSDYDERQSTQISVSREGISLRRRGASI